MQMNPYQPPTPVPTEEVGLWKRLLQAIRGGPGGRRSNLAFAEVETVQFVLSGQVFLEYGVVFSAMPGSNDRFFAAMPLVIDDEVHRGRNIVEAARVLRGLVARIKGLDQELSHRELVLSMVPSYQELATELCRVVIPPASWRRKDESDDLYLQWRELE